MGSREEVLSTCCSRMNPGSGWMELPSWLLFPVAALALPHSPSAYFLVSLDTRALHLPWTQVSHRRPTLKIRLPMVPRSPIDETSALKQMASSLPLPAHKAFLLHLCLGLPEHLPPWLCLWELCSFSEPNLGSSLLLHKNPRLLLPMPTHLQSLPTLHLIQRKLLYTCTSSLPNYLCIEEHVPEEQRF